MFVEQWVHLSFAIFAIFDLKRQLKLLEMAFDQVQTCLIFPFRWAHFPIEIGRNAQWVHLFSMDFDEFSIIYLISSLKAILQWVQLILSIEASDAIRPGYDCFISMIISVETLCGFGPL